MKIKLVLYFIGVMLLLCACSRNKEVDVKKIDTESVGGEPEESEATIEETEEIHAHTYVDVNKPAYAIETVEKRYSSVWQEWTEQIYRRDVYNAYDQKLFSWVDTDILARIYDEKGVIVESHEVYTTGTDAMESSFYEYDDNGNCISCLSIDILLNEYKRTLYTYVNNLLVLKEIYVDDIIKEKDEYVYNEMNQLIRRNHEWYYDGKLEELSHWEYIYDEHGKEIERKEYKNNRTQNHYITEYYETGERYIVTRYVLNEFYSKNIYDKSGNIIIECLEQGENGDRTEYEYRRLSDAELTELLDEIFYHTENMY